MSPHADAVDAMLASAVNTSNPLGARRTSVSPVLKSSSRISLAKMSSSSFDQLAKASASALEEVSFRPSFGAKRPSCSSAASPVAPPTNLPSFPTPRTLTSSSRTALANKHLSNVHDSLRRSQSESLIALARRQYSACQPKPLESAQSENTPLSRKSSLGRRTSQIEAQHVQVLKRTVSVLAPLPSPISSSNMSPPQTPSILEIRSQIMCRNMKLNGVCPFGPRCHYKHDDSPMATSFAPIETSAVDNSEVDMRILGIRKEIVCRNFTTGSCPFGQRCFYKHCDTNGNVVEETGVDSRSAINLVCFPNPHGDGDVAAAGVIPYAAAEGFDDGAVWALVQVEDMLDEETNTWKPALAMFGGKVSAEDSDWLQTSAREFMEETGSLVGDMERGIPSKMAQFCVDDDEEAFSYTKYLEYSKYQVLYYPVVDEDDLKLMRDLPSRYTETFKGEISSDWTRAATRLEPVLLRKDVELGWTVHDINTGKRHELPVKVPLLMALKAAEFVTPASSTSNDVVEDLLGGALDSLLNINITAKPQKAIAMPKASAKKSHRNSRRSSGLAALSESPNENIFSVLASMSSSEVLCA